MKTYSYKLGSNRGIRNRVWIEGKRLSANGFNRGTRYRKITSENKIILVIDSNGSLGVAGTDTRPIIDMCGQNVAEIFNGHERVNATFEPNKITIIGGEKA